MPFWKCFPCRKFKNEETVIVLDHSNCALTDVPPDVLQYERTLEKLYLSSNRISALSPQLFYCQGMRVLCVNDNELESLPSAIGSLRHLHTLNLARNNISTIPENIISCKNLTHLDLSVNSLQKLPDAITGLIALEELVLNETNLEFLPANFGRLVNLKILELRSNNLITLPKSMSRLSNLTRIDIGSNEFTELPEVICQLTQLRELWIDVNQIRRVSPNVSNLRELKHFEAKHNLLTTLPNEISNWRNLEVLSISNNDVESLPFSIGMLKSLINLECESNQLRKLPDSICNLENLEELAINHNLILRLPRTIGMLRKLRYLCADQNVLRNLPNEICSCSSLVVLSVRENKIVELPQNIGHLENLEVLNLVDNYIEHLPVSVWSLTKLTALWLSDNQSQPLVPLQYLNDNTKSHLTCFMLPQQTAATANQPKYTQTLDCSDDDSTNSLLHQQTEQSQHEYFNGKKNANSLSQRIYFSNQQPQQGNRICFADDSGSQFGTNGVGSDPDSSPMRRIYFADEVKGSENLATRLMRSPTPYPKELRLMAKLVRTNQQQQQQLQQNNDQQYRNGMIVARVSPSGSSQIDDKHNLPENLPLPLPSTVSIVPGEGNGGVKEARILLNPNGNSVYLQQVPNYHFVDRNRTLDADIIVANNVPNDNSRMQYLKQPNIYADCRNNQIKNHVRQSPLIDINGDELYNNQIQQYYHNFHPTQQQQPIYPSLYQQQSQDIPSIDIASAKELLGNLSVSPSKTSSHSQISLNDLQTQATTKPPPYHIARIYTKKSREDLLSYDTFHNKIQHNHVSDGINNFNLDDRQNDNFFMPANVNGRSNNFNHQQNSNQFNDDQLINQYLNNNKNDYAISMVDNQNNNNSGVGLNQTFSVDCPDGRILSIQNAAYSPDSSTNVGNLTTETTIAAEAVEHYKNNEDDINRLKNSTPTSVQANIDGESKLPPPLRSGSTLGLASASASTSASASGSTTPWLFGLHKNPTVKQVAIKRDQTIGFEIIEKSNKGIFVSGTQPNTSAATLLHANDKLLEVNGYDFTKICLNEAQEILENSGPLINVMISRT